MATTLSNTLNMHSVPQQLALAEAAVEKDTLDLSGIIQCDSAGVAMLLELSRRWQAKGLKLRFIGAPPQLLQLTRFFELDEALGLVGST